MGLEFEVRLCSGAAECLVLRGETLLVLAFFGGFLGIVVVYWRTVSSCPWFLLSMSDFEAQRHKDHGFLETKTRSSWSMEGKGWD